MHKKHLDLQMMNTHAGVLEMSTSVAWQFFCVALKGYHPLTTYQWFEDDILLNNPHPLLYTGRTGKYKCLMQSGQKERMQEFCVFGMSLVYCIH